MLTIVHKNISLLALGIILAYVFAPPFHGPESYLLMLTYLCLFAGYLYTFLSPNNQPNIYYRPLLIAVMLYWAWLGLSILWSPAPWVSFYMLVWLSVFPLTLLIYTNRDQKSWQPIAWGISGLTLIYALTGIAQSAIFQQTPSALFGTPNTYAGILNLVSLPLAAYFLYCHRQHDRKRATLAAAGLFILFYAVAQTGGRGAMLALLIGMLCLYGLAWRHAKKTALAILFTLCFAAFLAVNLQTHELVSTRLSTLTKPEQAAFSRTVIWQPAWEMAKAHPWLGIGLGNYSLFAAAVRHPEDTSAGFFVHNDYLQIWLETGLIGLVLFLFIFLVTGKLFLGILRHNNLSPAQRFETIGLFAGLIAISVHSFVDFHFYIAAILILMAVMLGRIQEIYLTLYPGQRWQLQLNRVISKPVYYFAVLALPVICIAYLGPISIAKYYRTQGLQQLKTGQLQRAEKNLQRAHRWYATDAKILNDLGELYRHGLTLIKTSAPAKEREALFNKALHFISLSEQLNPLLGLNTEIRGQLYYENADIAGDNWQQQASAAFQRALEINPKLYYARMAYARLLRDTGNLQQAVQVINGGLDYWYNKKTSVSEYYALARELNAQADHADIVNKIESKYINN